MRPRILALNTIALGCLAVGCTTTQDNAATPIAAFTCHVANAASMVQIFRSPGKGDYFVRLRIFSGDTATAKASISPAAIYPATRAGDVVTYWMRDSERYVGMIRKTEALGQEINIQTGRAKSLRKVDGVVSSPTGERQCDYSPADMKAERLN